MNSVGCLIIFIIAIIIYSFFINFPELSFLILPPIIIITIIRKIYEQNKLQNKISIEYLEYCESTKGEDNAMSYEEFEQLSIDSIKKKRREATMKRYESLLSKLLTCGNKPSAFNNFFKRFERRWFTDGIYK